VDLNKNHELDTAMRDIHRVESFDELDEVKVLKCRNKQLKDKLAKKYRHVKQLEKRIATLEGMVMISQSGMVSDEQPPPGVEEYETSQQTDQQITAFADQDAGWVTEKVGTYDATMDLANNMDSSLASFLGRPIRQSAQTWVVGQPFFYKFNPWAAFCTNSKVNDKITNFQLLRMKLHVKIVISGTKFHYGRALVSYDPFKRNDQITVDRNFIQQDLIMASQKPHIFLNPTKNSGGEMCLPFFYDKNYMRIPTGDWDEMGQIVISSFGNLLHANGGDDPVTITTYIWAEDVVLTVPTQSTAPLTSQSGRRTNRKSKKDQSNTINSQDEYGSGIISKPAAAIAKAAGALSELPLIGPYMTATQIGAGAVGKVAQMFGYSRPNVISDIQLYKPLPAGNLANTDAADASQKLTLDSKAELTVDSRTVGLDGSDEMGILDYVKRESFLTSFAWSPSDSVDDLLWNTRVLPMQLDNINGEIHMTPLAHMATAFESWQGSIKFRFQIVKSDFHKGRILVRWDPNQLLSSIDYNVNYSRVIDIAETDDFEIVVGWGQKDPFLNCGAPYSTGSNFSSVQRLLSSGESNGILEVAVLNDLVSPSVDAPISINVFVSACDDFKLAAPTNNNMEDLHLFPEILPSQSGSPNVETGDMTSSDKPTSSGELQTIAKQSDQNDNTFLVFYGDPPCSIRELCKRYTYTRTWAPEDAPPDSIELAKLTNKAMPYYTGWDPNGISTSEVSANKLTVGSTAYSSWFIPSYAGWRGSFRKKYYFFGNTIQTPLVIRGGSAATGNGFFDTSASSLTNSKAYLSKFVSSKFGNGSGAGTAAQNTRVNTTIEAEFPYYKRTRFSNARVVRAQGLDCNSHVVQTQEVNISTQGPRPELFNIAYQQHDAVGEDFSLFFFTGVPIYYKYDVDETS
jgi:hypothetical protein